MHNSFLATLCTIDLSINRFLIGDEVAPQGLK